MRKLTGLESFLTMLMTGEFLTIIQHTQKLEVLQHEEPYGFVIAFNLSEEIKQQQVVETLLTKLKDVLKEAATYNKDAKILTIQVTDEDRRKIKELIGDVGFV